MTRKLIRPNLSELREQLKEAQQKKKTPPPYETHAENYYYLKQMSAKTPMIIVMQDGEVIKGRIEWYDRDVIKVHRDGEPNLLIFKSAIKYILKDEEKLKKQKEKKAD